MSKMMNVSGDSSTAAPKPSKIGSGTIIEKSYQKKSLVEHMLLRPDIYIGSVQHEQELMWVFDREKGYMVQREINYCPGLFKIFDEILVNAADNKQRDNNMDCIQIDIDKASNTVSIWNNGKGIPVVLHTKENLYVPTLIFGHLHTSSNYDDGEEKVVGGGNGIGAKLCNIFSTTFTVETGSKYYIKQFKQTWRNNMTKVSEPNIKPYTGEDFTKITFSPDLGKFHMETLDDDIVALMSRRAYDIAASSRGVKVFLNGERVRVRNFKDYVDLYIKGREDDPNGPHKVIYQNANDRWEVAVTISDCGYQQVSFVNSIATTKGGRHVDYVTCMVVKKLLEVLQKKNKGGVAMNPFQVKNQIWVFVNCVIVNPSFDSQTKENMTTQITKFGSTCELNDKFIKRVSMSGIVETILSRAQNEHAEQSEKKQYKLKGIPKLEDAIEAGTRNAHKCTLILTEGDSAKCLAVSGLGVVGRDVYGVYPLRGKLLNVREATQKQILNNIEINTIIKILGLQYDKKYQTIDDLKSLRYGKVMIMTDQDQDGSHIKGLIINFVHYFWPELLRLNFLEIFITPIVKVFKKYKPEVSFYSLPEFEEWKSEINDQHTYVVKYYKGLGTSTSNEAKEYFKNIEHHRIALKYSGRDDDKNILLAFSRKEADSRKDWLRRHNDDVKKRKEAGVPEVYLYTKNTRTITFSEYVNKELVYYSNANSVRTIPSIVDGLKPGQRKVLYTCLKRDDKREVKVAQLAGSVAEMSAYHHGEQSLSATIINLAQNYVGSNNINLLEPRGQFGTRLQGGKDSANARYIFTKMSPLTRLIFHPHDDALLRHETDDNQEIEPVWYIPIIPMVLVNGAEGIGTGWNTKIPNFNPRNITAALRSMLAGKEPPNLKPWYKNFRGSIDYCGEQRYVTSGEIGITNDKKIQISELPIGTWTQMYRDNVLEPLLHGTDKVKAVIEDYKEYSTDTTVKFVVTPLAGTLTQLEHDDIHNTFKLQTTMSLNNMVLFDEFGAIKKYDNVKSILKEFYTIRLRMYVKRKEYLEAKLEAEASKLHYQAKFILQKCSGKFVVENKQNHTIIDELIKRGYPADPVEEWNAKVAHEMNEEDEAEEGEVYTGGSSAVDSEKEFKKMMSYVKKYNYLVGMSMWMLTDENKNRLLKQRDDKIMELNILKNKTPADLWREDLDEFETKLDVVEEIERKDEMESNKKDTTKTNGGTKQKITSYTNSSPSTNARRIEPKLTEAVKKVTEAIRVKEKTTSTLNSSSQIQKYKKPKKHYTSDEDEEDVKSWSDFDISFSPVIPRDRISRRAATNVKPKYKQQFDIETDSSDDSPELFDNPIEISESICVKKDKTTSTLNSSSQGGTKQKITSYTNSSPSTNARRIEPKLTEAVKKVTEAIRVKEKTTSTLNSSSQIQKYKKPKKHYTSDEDEEDVKSWSDFDISFSPVIPRDRISRRAATNVKPKYKQQFDIETDSSDDSPELFDNPIEISESICVKKDKTTSTLNSSSQGGTKQKITSYANSSPSTNARRIDPKLTEAVKKFTEAIRVQEKTTSTLNSSSQDEKDPFDVMLEEYKTTLKDKLSGKSKKFYTSDKEESCSESFENDLVQENSEEDFSKPFVKPKTSAELFDPLFKNSAASDDSDVPIAGKMAATKRKAICDNNTNAKKAKSCKKR